MDLISLSREQPKESGYVPFSSSSMSGRINSPAGSWSRQCFSHISICRSSSSVIVQYSAQLCGGPAVHGCSARSLGRSKPSGRSSSRSSLESSLVSTLESGLLSDSLSPCLPISSPGEDGGELGGRETSSSSRVTSGWGGSL